MAEPILPQNSDSGRSEYTQELQQFIYRFLEEQSSLREDYKSLELHTTSATITHIDENYINKQRLQKLKTQYTPQLIQLILESDFEYGIDSKVDPFVLEQMDINSFATMNWINDVFFENIDKPAILIGVLRLISRLPHYYLYSQCLAIAGTALSHEDTEVKECGVRAFENWGNLESLHTLEHLSVSPPWLQDYVNRVVGGLREVYNVSVS